MRYSLLFALAVAVTAAALTPLPGADWPAWRGPDRTGVSSETGLLATWPEGGPKLLWKTDKAGLGYAGMAVVGGTVYTMGATRDDEWLLAFDDKGQKAWSTKVGPVHDWEGNSWSRGPNATPTVDGDLVFALASKGDLICVKKADGARVWSKNLPGELSAEVNKVGGGIPKLGWGFSWSPLVDGDRLIIVPGGPRGLFAALNKKTGEVLWRSKEVTEAATYSSPVAATVGGVKQYVYLTQGGVTAVAAADGRLLWRWKREDPYGDVVCPTPIVKGDQVYVTVGRNGGCALLKITPAGKGFTATAVYQEEAIANRQGGVVLLGKHVYGYNEDRNWACQEFATGQIAWPKKRTRQAVKDGGVLAADGKLFTLDEEGTVGLLAASPKAYKTLASFALPKTSDARKSGGKVWTHPSLSDGKLYLRDQELIYCYQVK